MYTDLKIKLGSAIHEQTKLQLTTFLTAISGGPLLFKETLHFVEYPKKALIHLDSMLEPAACLFCGDWICDQFHFSH